MIVGAVVVVNSLGDIVDPSQVASSPGCAPAGLALSSSRHGLPRRYAGCNEDPPRRTALGLLSIANTVVGVVRPTSV